MTDADDGRVLFTAIRVGDNGYAEKEAAFSGRYLSESYFGTYMFLQNAVEGVTYEVRTSSGNGMESRYLADWTCYGNAILWSHRRWLR